LQSLFRELKHRRVFRVAIAYVVVAFAVLQGADVLATAMALPEWALALVACIPVFHYKLLGENDLALDNLRYHELVRRTNLPFATEGRAP
jgi:Flp pilus assembly protein protease CpaA